ncbi:PqqD family protein [bacterium]|nr:PqqD family protein [bacterium]
MKREKLTDLAINQSGFIFDPATGYSYNANETAVLIIDQLIEGKEVEQIVEQLIIEFEVAKDEALSDVEYFLRVLENYNLVERTNAY